MDDIERYRRKARRGPKLRKLIIVVALLAFAGGLFALYRMGDAMPTASPPASRSAPTVDLTQPFAGTPAAKWRDGEAGLVVPEAKTVGTHSAQQVTDAMTRVRQVVILARLNRQVIVSHDYAPYLAALAPASNVRPKLVPGAGLSNWITPIADGFPLLDLAPKVDGSMSVSADEEGRLVVHTNYVFAYAFRPDKPEHARDTSDIVAMHHVSADYIVIDDPRWADDEQGIWPSDTSTYFYWMSCSAADKGLLAPSYSDGGQYTVNPSVEQPRDYFDPKHALDVPDGCKR